MQLARKRVTRKKGGGVADGNSIVENIFACGEKVISEWKGSIMTDRLWIPMEDNPSVRLSR